MDIPDAPDFPNDGAKLTFLSPDWIEPELMIFEDLQFLPTKSTAQLMQILDQREQVEKATLITSLRSPITMEGFPNRLLGRLARFLILSIPNLSFESRLLFLTEILREKAKDLLTLEAQIWFAQRVTSLRELVALPQKIEPLKKIHPPPWDVANLVDFFEAEPKPERPPLEALTIRVAEKYQLRWRELLGKSRLKIIVRARHLAMTLARRKGYSLNEIGTYFGGRDHKSISHAVQSIEELIKTDLSLEKELKEMLQQ
jgi:chromosomal replication initiator protein